MVTVIATWKVKKDEMNNALNALEELTVLSRQEPGNLKYDPYIKLGTEDEVLIYESYQTMADFEYHKETPYFKDIVTNKIKPLLESSNLSVLEN